MSKLDKYKSKLVSFELIEAIKLAANYTNTAQKILLMKMCKAGEQRTQLFTTLYPHSGNINQAMCGVDVECLL